MKRRQWGREAQIRQHIASEAARIMTEEGLRDFAAAKRKAALRLNVEHTRNLPANTEVETALMEYQRLFRSDTQPARLRQLREAALNAMKMLEAFNPHLVGPVLSGSADEFSAVNIHLFADTTEEVDLFLEEANIPHSQDERQLRLSSEQTKRYPVFRFVAGDVTLELTVFERGKFGQTPLSPVDGRPMRRANRAAVERLLEGPQAGLSG